MNDFDRIVVGAQYYRPPNPPSPDWGRDLRMMADAGMNTVKFWACWSWMNPEKDRYDFADLDRLKYINDTYGHRAGDRRIIDYTRCWARAVPRDAVLARLGGDEFAICVVHSHAGTVERLLGEIRTQTPAVSFGVCTDRSETADIAQLYARADADLYRGRGVPLRDELDPR